MGKRTPLQKSLLTVFAHALANTMKLPQGEARQMIVNRITISAGVLAAATGAFPLSEIDTTLDFGVRYANLLLAQRKVVGRIRTTQLPSPAARDGFHA